MKRICMILCGLLLLATGYSQNAAPQKKEGWHLLDPRTSGYLGISMDEAYKLVEGRKPSTVIVAVIDSGLDTTQEDLQQVIWVNEKEIPANGIDDDGNGYVDDVHGWNFCGSSTGENLARNSHEIARVYHHWRSEFEGKKENRIPADRRFLYGQWKKAEKLINDDYKDASTQLPRLNEYLEILEKSSALLAVRLTDSNFTAATIRPLTTSSDETIANSAKLWTDVFDRFNDASVKRNVVLDELRSYVGRLNTMIDRKNNAPEDFRGKLNGDNIEDINDRIYGNNNLKTGSGDHGTLVSGTIGATRNNGKGMDGIADHVRIMGVRAVPGGDEHDKDVALAIRYAVDNGAKVINMSFGKPVSPYKKMVDDAVRYASSKNVLLVHGSGNDGKDITSDIFYPNPVFLEGDTATNYITVGASGDQSTGYIAAPFSNYSQRSVDVFAPGMYIYATATDNRYVGADGTSLASPVVTGIAAFLLSYFPSLTPQQVKKILVETGVPVPGEVPLPGNPEKLVSFNSLSVSGKLINAAEAVRMALAMEKQVSQK
ncbi:MAG: S8 family serine peptidase [Chitinophagaceae bacterium]